MYYTNKPIEKTSPVYCENPSKERKNLLLGLPIHAIEEKEFFNNPGELASRNFDTDSTLLTDGKYSPDREFGNAEWFHMNRGGGRIITFKLPYICAVDGFCVSALRKDGMGIRTPRYLKVRVSVDGENFETVYNDTDSRTAKDFKIHKLGGGFKAVKALYVQIIIEVVQHVFVDEIEVYGCTDVTDAADPVANDISLWEEFKAPKEYHKYPDAKALGCENISLVYNFANPDTDICIKKEEELLPQVAYLDKEGNIKDTLMDGVLFLPDVSFDFHPKGAKCAEGWKAYMDSIFIPERNLDALNNAVEKVKTALNKPDYKVGVYYTILYTFTDPDVFGELGGETTAFEDMESRQKGVKWLVDTYIRRHNEGNYSNTEIKGFYWFEEALNPWDKHEEDMIRWACDYIHSLGYKCFWVPYYKAQGCENWKDYGFDVACMQPNYAFDDVFPGLTPQRLYDTAAEAKRVGMCVELEIWKVKEDENGNIDNPDNIERLVNYFRVGAETGYMNSIKIYYHGSQISECITNGWKSKNPRYRELYDMCYLYSKNQLKAD